ncbi:MAG TPA: ribosomal-processing cysteine protease Prp [Lachnospiraceae bacterium]|nr:ribosomal-processing cysteine protease Prp [Lachnospiraceae bacterium]
MITVTVFTKKGVYQGFETDGHAGYAEKGKDIICAAVSALTVNTVNSITELAKDKVIAGEQDGNVRCIFPDPISDQGKLLMDSMVLGIDAIVKNYGKTYLCLKFEEV